MKLTKNFDLIEWKCKDDTPVPAKLHQNAWRLARTIQVIRYRLQIRFGEEKRLKIGSGYRTPEHNRKEGGKPYSRHLTAEAADIHPLDGLTVEELYEEIEAAIEDGDIEDGGLAKNVKAGFVHWDVRGKRARWEY
jgi:uncharacterized protein YcbK (DUF882 family)